MKTRSFLLAASIMLAMAFTVFCAENRSSAFVGKWVRDDGSESIELFKDGTGIFQKGNERTAISWKVMDKRFVVTATVWGSLVSTANNYKMSGNKLTFTDDKGESETYVKPQKGKIEGKTLTDNRDGKKYKTVIIGERTWMAENLNYEANGSVCYDNKPENCDKYGRLYDWNTAKEACPSGWHLPSYEEWKIDGYVGGEAGKKLKSKNGWNNNGNGTDDYGFAALPGGGGSSGGDFGNVGNYGGWWSASEHTSDRAYLRSMGYNYEDARWINDGKGGLLSVRCLQD